MKRNNVKTHRTIIIFIFTNILEWSECVWILKYKQLFWNILSYSLKRYKVDINILHNNHLNLTQIYQFTRDSRVNIFQIKFIFYLFGNVTFAQAQTWGVEVRSVMMYLKRRRDIFLNSCFLKEYLEKGPKVSCLTKILY